jgi:hypothetical protein
LKKHVSQWILDHWKQIYKLVYIYHKPQFAWL